MSPARRAWSAQPGGPATHSTVANPGSNCQERSLSPFAADPRSHDRVDHRHAHEASTLRREDVLDEEQREHLIRGRAGLVDGFSDEVKRNRLVATPELQVLLADIEDDVGGHRTVPRRRVGTDALPRQGDD